MRIILEDEVREIRNALAPFEPAFADSIRAAWAQWLTISRMFRFQPRAGCRSTTVHELIVQEVAARFSDRMFRSRGRVMMRISNGLIVQFKKLDRKGLPKNYPTQLALLFELQLRIPGMPYGTRATIGYRPDDIGMNLLELSVVIQDANGARSWPMRDVVAPVIPAIQPGAANGTRRRARLKTDAAPDGKVNSKNGTGGNDDDDNPDR